MYTVIQPNFTLLGNQELIKLQKRLANTEAAMAKILKQMGDASEKLSATVPSELKDPLLQTKKLPVLSESIPKGKELRTEILSEEHQNKDSTPDIDSYEVVCLSPNEDAEMNDENHHDNSEIQDTNVTSTSSFECISSNDNTPLSPDKDINVEVVKMDFSSMNNSKIDETVIEDK
ncbi:hypothetical protein GQR58_028054 [Nymphon striatum]|nr:hypothetical protein GQR58_028054 [Nymphon striatum]